MAHSLAPGGENPRSYARLHVGISARLDTIQGRQEVRLLDLSQGGAHFIISREEQVREGVLSWLNFDAFGDLAWQDGEHVGLRFEALIPVAALVETRQRAPSVVLDEAMGDALLAREWVNGLR